MPLTIASAETYAELIAQPGLTLVMCDFSKERFGNARKLRVAFRSMAILHPTMLVVHVDMCHLGTIVGKVPFCPTFRMYRDGELLGEWYTYSRRSDRVMICWAEGYLPEDERTEMERIEYKLRHGIKLSAGYIREPLDIHFIGDFLAKAMERFKRLDGPFTAGPYFCAARHPGKRAICSLSLSHPGDREGTYLSARQWLEAINWAYASVHTLEDMVENADGFLAASSTDPSGWVTEMLETLRKPYGHLRALSKMFRQAEGWDSEKA